MNIPPLPHDPLPLQQFSIQFLTKPDIPQTIRLLANHYITSQKLSQQQFQQSNIPAHLEKFLLHIIECNTSFVVKESDNSKENNNRVIGCCISLDVKELLVLFQGKINFSVFEMLGMFTNRMRNWVYRLGDCRKGDYLFNIVTVFQQKLFDSKNAVDSLLRGIAFSKIIGWKAILYPTTDPFFMLRLGGEVMGALAVSQSTEKEIQQERQSYQLTSPFTEQREQTVLLQKILHHGYTYIIAMRLQKLKFKYIDLEESRIGPKINSLQEKNSGLENDEKRRKLYLLPKL